MEHEEERNIFRKLPCSVSYSIWGGGGVVPVQLDQVVEGEEDTHQVDQDPQEVQDVVPE